MHPKPDFNLVFNGFFHVIIQEAKEVITRERLYSIHGVGSSSDGNGIRSVGADKGYGMIGGCSPVVSGVLETNIGPHTIITESYLTASSRARFSI